MASDAALSSLVARRPTSLHHEEEVMGTIVTIDLYDEDGMVQGEIQRHLDRAMAVLHGADTVFSTWKPESLISRIRRGELEVGCAPKEVGEVMERCAKARRVTGGWFDPWAMPGGFDPTGLVKGWAAQCALEALKPSGASGAIVNAAGDIATFGSPGASTPFRVGIVDPFDTSKLAFVAEVWEAIATSGTYERGSHLFDPFDGTPRARVASATVVGPDLGLADALATALAIAGESLLDELAELEGYEALAIGLGGQARATPRFPLG
jgi:thiamine biosynthesis lipoprotein